MPRRDCRAKVLGKKGKGGGAGVGTNGKKSVELSKGS